MYSFYFRPHQSLSHALILCSVIVSILGFIFPIFKGNFMLSSYVLHLDIITIFSQIILFQFLHADIFHLFMNSAFLFSGIQIEARMSRDAFLTFFLSNTIFIVIAFILFAPKNTAVLWISGFCTAILSYLSIDLYTTRHHRFQEFFGILVINIFVWLLPWISFIWHFFGAIWGVIFYFLLKKYKKYFS